MSHLITVQYPYQHLEVSFLKNQTIVETKKIPKFEAVKLLIPTIQSLLDQHHCKLNEIAAIGINVGPGPFNTLRSIITTANGINFVNKTPLIACNGLTMLLQNKPNTVALLNAFGKDVYFAFNDKQGYCSIANLVNDLNNEFSNETIEFIGNGSIQHKDFIIKSFAGTATFNANQEFASPEAMANETYQHFVNKNFTKQLRPLYFQSPAIKL